MNKRTNKAAVAETGRRGVLGADELGIHIHHGIARPTNPHCHASVLRESYECIGHVEWAKGQ